MTEHDRSMTVLEAADVLEKVATLPWPLAGPIGRALRVLIDHARATAERPTCDWCEAPATVALPDFPDDGDARRSGRPSRACHEHDAEFGVGRSMPLRSACATAKTDPALTGELRACFGICDHVDCLP